MNKLFNSFYDGYINTELPSKKNIHIKSISTPELLIHKNSFLNEDNFISDEIKNEIKKYNYCYEIKINPSQSFTSFYPYESNKYMPHITIYYLMKNKKEPSLKSISPQLRRICFISNLYSKHNSDSTPLKCWFCPTSNIKLLPQMPASTSKSTSRSISTPIILGPDNVNSGLSIPDIRHIKIWREEELNKVLTHELIHTYKLDKAIYNTNEVNDYIRTILNISPSNKINVNEAYTEGLTTILNTIFIMIDNKINNNINTQSQYKKYKSILNTELDFSINQTAKILHYNRYNNINELFIKPVKNINNINNNHKQHKWKQKSNVLSYYLIKTALLNNLNDFIKFLKSTNCFKVTNKNIPQFKLLLNQSLRNKNFIKKVNTKMRNINTNRNTNIKLKQKSSLRMTFFG